MEVNLYKRLDGYAGLMEKFNHSLALNLTAEEKKAKDEERRRMRKKDDVLEETVDI